MQAEDWARFFIKLRILVQFCKNMSWTAKVAQSVIVEMILNLSDSVGVRTLRLVH